MRQGETFRREERRGRSKFSPTAPPWKEGPVYMTIIIIMLYFCNAHRRRGVPNYQSIHHQCQCYFCSRFSYVSLLASASHHNVQKTVREVEIHFCVAQCETGWLYTNSFQNMGLFGKWRFRPKFNLMEHRWYPCA